MEINPMPIAEKAPIRLPPYITKGVPIDIATPITYTQNPILRSPHIINAPNNVIIEATIVAIPKIFTFSAIESNSENSLIIPPSAVDINAVVIPLKIPNPLPIKVRMHNTVKKVGLFGAVVKLLIVSFCSIIYFFNYATI